MGKIKENEASRPQEGDRDSRMAFLREATLRIFCEGTMGDTSVMKVQSRHSPRGEMGQKLLALGIHMAMRLWDKEQPSDAKPATMRDYETVDYVIEGRAELHLDGQMVLLEPGNSWVVPKGASHSYKVLEPFTAVEATCPPAVVHGRDQM
jgi:quercetin dioxygenase-like cupin family protein